MAAAAATPAATTAATAAPPAELIIIHVSDEARQINRDFACDRQILLEEMKYFRSYLGSESGSFDDIDISVHCDVHIFEWLVQWIHAPLRPPPLDSHSVVSILISSEFLEMDRLVEHCLRFMAANIEEILKTPIDLACVSDSLVTRLAGLCTADVLSRLTDEKLLPKLYKRRLEIDFRHRDTTLNNNTNKNQAPARSMVGPPKKHPFLEGDDGAGSEEEEEAAAHAVEHATPRVVRCEHCARLYPAWAQQRLSCSSSPLLVDLRGALVSRHVAIPWERWSLTEHVAALHAAGMGWGEIYWLMWGVTHIFRCRTCEAWFAADDSLDCRFHAAEPAFQPGCHRGAYACCARPAVRFSPDAPVPGCAARDHAVDERRGSAKKPLALELLARQATAIAAASARARNGGRLPASSQRTKQQGPENGDDNNDGDDDDPNNKSKPSSADNTSHTPPENTTNNTEDDGNTNNNSNNNKKKNNNSNDPATKDATNPQQPASKPSTASASGRRGSVKKSSAQGARGTGGNNNATGNKPPKGGDKGQAAEATAEDPGGGPTAAENHDAALPSSRRGTTRPHHSVFGAVPAAGLPAAAHSRCGKAPAARCRGEDHPLTSMPSESARDAKERRDHAQLSPRRRRARELDCVWRERDVAAMTHLSKLLMARRTAWTANDGVDNNAPGNLKGGRETNRAKGDDPRAKGDDNKRGTRSINRWR